MNPETEISMLLSSVTHVLFCAHTHWEHEQKSWRERVLKLLTAFPGSGNSLLPRINPTEVPKASATSNLLVCFVCLGQKNCWA